MEEMTEIISQACSNRRIGRLVRRRTMHNDAGQSLVELALVAPVFFLLLLGAAEFGRLAYAGIEVNNAARAGVAYGAQSFATASDVTGIEMAATNDAANVIGLTTTPITFCSCADAPGGPVDCFSASTTCAGSHVLNYLKVSTSATVKPLIPYPGLPSSFTLTGQAIMRVGQ